jgi:hypothetical protein
MKKKKSFRELFRMPDQLPRYPGEVAQASADPTAPLALREAVRINDSTLDKLWKFYYEPQKKVLLSEKEEEMRRRIVNVWELLTGQILNDRKAAQAQVQWCKDNFMHITERTAYDDVRRAKQLFGDPRVSMALYEKARISAILLDCIAEAKKIGDLYNVHRLISRYNAVNALESNIKDIAPRAPIIIQFHADEETLKKQAAELMQGVKGTIDITPEEEDDQGS